MLHEEVIKKDEVVIFENQISRLFDSRQITAYLSDLRKESGSAFPYALLVEYVKSIGC